MVGPMWLILWQAETVLGVLGQDPRLSKDAASYLHAMQWGLLPFFLYLCLRGFVAALQRPGWALVIVLFAVAFNAIANWCLIFGRLGFPALGLPGSAHAIAIQIASLTFMVPLGIGQAGTVRVGHAFGAGDRDGVARAGATALTLALGFMALAALAMAFVPHAVFLDASRPGAEAVAELAVVFLFYAALFQLADGAQVVGSSILRGLGDTRRPMLLAGLGYWGVGLPLSAALGFLTPLAGRGIWIGLAFGLSVVAVLMLRRWWARERLGLLRGLRITAG
jgi:MATE family multidrug resistance protein